MKRCHFLSACLVLLCFVVSAAHAGTDLVSNVDGILADGLLAKAQVGVEIVRLGASAAECKVVYRHNSDALLTPASNLKLLTTSAALDRLGPDFKFRTQLVFHNGDLILFGDGDPAFGDADILTRVGWDVDTVFKNWAAQIKTLSLGPIKNILVDDSIFDSDFFQPNWSADQRLDTYEPEVAGMNLNINCLDFFLKPTQPGKPVMFRTNPAVKFLQIRNQCLTGPGTPSLRRDAQSNDMILKGSVDSANDVPYRYTIHDPPLLTANVLAATLGDAAIAHSGDVHRDRSMRTAMNKATATGDKSWQVLGINETPLSMVMARANKSSVNLYSECLCKRLGAEATGQPGSWQNGTAAVGAFLTKIGVPAGEFHLDDGCGLSKENRVTPSVFSRVLVHDFFSPNAKAFADSLAIAAVDGTLRERFRDGRVRGRVLAKTGHVDGVSCLSGYLHARDGQWYTFSILMNKPGNESVVGGNQAQEAIVAAIDGK